MAKNTSNEDLELLFKETLSASVKRKKMKKDMGMIDFKSLVEQIVKTALIEQQPPVPPQQPASPAPQSEQELYDAAKHINEAMKLLKTFNDTKGKDATVDSFLATLAIYRKRLVEMSGVKKTN